MRPELPVSFWGSNCARKLATDMTVASPVSVFTVTGDVLMVVFGICKTALTVSGGTPTIEVGVSGNTAAFIPSTTASLLVANEIWFDATPDASVEDLAALSVFGVSDGQDAIITVGGTGTVDTGAVDFYCFWYPLSEGASVVPAP